MKEFVKKIFSFPGARRTPQVMLHQTLEKVDRIKAVVMIIQWDDETMGADWSAMKVSELCMASNLLEADVARTLLNEG